MRLPRKHIPVKIRCRVAMRQLDLVMCGYAGGHGAMLKFLLARLAEKIVCQPSDLRLDHDPPLAARRQIKRKGKIVGYVPHEHAPDHLKYRPHGAEFAGSHLIKTNIRGDHGQHPDRVLIKQHKRRERAAAGLAQDVKRGRPLGASKGTPRKTAWPIGRKIRSRGFTKPGATA